MSGADDLEELLRRVTFLAEGDPLSAHSSGGRLIGAMKYLMIELLLHSDAFVPMMGVQGFAAYYMDDPREGNSLDVIAGIQGGAGADSAAGVVDR